MRVVTEHGPVFLSLDRGKATMRRFAGRWPLPVVEFAEGAPLGAIYGLCFRAGETTARCLHLHFEPEPEGDAELVLELVLGGVFEALRAIGRQRQRGLLLATPTLREAEGGLEVGLAVFAAEADGGQHEPGEGPLAKSFLRRFATTVAGAQLPPFPSREVVARDALGGMRLDIALVDGDPICMALAPEGMLDAEAIAALEPWVERGVREMAWAPTLPHALGAADSVALQRDGALTGALSAEQLPTEGPLDDAEPKAESTETFGTPRAAVVGPPPAPPVDVVDDGQPAGGGQPLDPAILASLPGVVPQGAPTAAPATDEASPAPTEMVDVGELLDETEVVDVDELVAETELVDVAELVAETELVDVSGVVAAAETDDAPVATETVAETELVDVADLSDAEEPAETELVDVSEVVTPPALAPRAAAPNSAAYAHVATEDAAENAVAALDGFALTRLLRVGPDAVIGELIAAAVLAVGRAGEGECVPAAIGPVDAAVTVMPGFAGVENLIRGSDGETCAFAVRIGAGVDAWALDGATRRLRAGCGRLVVVDLLADDTLHLDGWEVVPLEAFDGLLARAAEVAADGSLFSAALGFSAALRQIAELQRADAAGDARAWREPLRSRGLLGLFERRLLTAALRVVTAQLGVHGWPIVAAGDKSPGRRLQISTSGMGEASSADLTIIDPAAQFAAGVRLERGKLLVFAEAYELARHGLPPAGTLSRRNDFLHAFAAACGLERGTITGAPTAPGRSLSLSRYALWQGAGRSELIERCIETVWVLWEHSEAGVFRPPTAGA